MHDTHEGFIDSLSHDVAGFTDLVGPFLIARRVAPDVAATRVLSATAFLFIAVFTQVPRMLEDDGATNAQQPKNLLK